uniref:marginal zone B- and B1-cell-specific protein-like isoform X1 n=1 Tax=Myxine glutinosa TaxID=7769 RepID=UPI00359010F5
MRRQTFGEMCRYVLALVVLCHAVSASRRVKTSSDWPSTSGTKNEHKFSLSSPELNDEEGHSQHMPAHLRCDACRAIAYQMQEFLQKVSNKLGNNLPESQLVDTLDSCCSQSWEEYGVKEVGGELRLSGPGLETKNSFGMLMGGGKWPFRMLQMCHGYLGEIGEEDLHEAFLKDPGNLASFLCYTAGGNCSKGGEQNKRVAKGTHDHDL